MTERRGGACVRFAAVVGVSFFVSWPAVALATVGGAETVRCLAWDARRARVWFVQGTAAGQGRAVGHFDAKSGKRVVLFSEGPDDSDERTSAAIDRLVSRICDKSRALQKVSLTQLGVSVKLRRQRPKIKGVRITDPGLYMESLVGVSLPWKIEIKAKGAKLATTTIDACDFSHNGLVSGYAQRGESFLVLVVSATGVCFEGGYRTDHLVFVRRAPKKAVRFLETYANDYPPEHVSASESGSVSFELDKVQIASALNTMGYRAYKAAKLNAARSYFHRAVATQIDEPFTHDKGRIAYPLPLFNLAATLARLGEKEVALDRLEALLSHPTMRNKFLKKIRREKDFESLRKMSRFDALMH